MIHQVPWRFWPLTFKPGFNQPGSCFVNLSSNFWKCFWIVSWLVWWNYVLKGVFFNSFFFSSFGFIWKHLVVFLVGLARRLFRWIRWMKWFGPSKGCFFEVRAFLWWNFCKYSDLTRPGPPKKVAEILREICWFHGNLGWWTPEIWGFSMLIDGFPGWWISGNSVPRKTSYVHLYMDALGCPGVTFSP